MPRIDGSTLECLIAIVEAIEGEQLGSNHKLGCKLRKILGICPTPTPKPESVTDSKE